MTSSASTESASVDSPPAQALRVRVKLWDGPTRVTHWGLVALIGFSWWAAKNNHLEWHRLSGYAVAALLIFRLTWGFVGSANARFAGFVKGPGAVLAYVRGLPERRHAAIAGHNPLGGWSVIAILSTLVAQIVTGLFAVDVDGMESGPLSDRVDFDTGRRFAEWHHWSFWGLEALVALHVTAVIFYLVYKRVDLLGPMITGRAWLGEDPGLRFASPLRAMLTALFAALIAWWLAGGLKL